MIDVQYLIIIDTLQSLGIIFLYIAISELRKNQK